ncbi:tetratricopeptide repeat protein [candidate division WOR-3 bacterium]|uniref:Tetratricopeptide repeat protein n=1 Tax=candidate division WOR-3 bacterium TaxID=2052148 RepID=A0A9D5QDL3_UNCW3|nr:tetratricopeptide repeat protein [candidate division WOR-3 bacterium]MBD3364170.1 tetratricopeptide repeat protein [candidate division WOR-3 bacterium]
MKKALIAALLCITVISALDSRLTQSDNYYYNRHKDASYGMKALYLCNEVLEENPNDANALWRTARLYCLLGDDESAKEKKLFYYQKAEDNAEDAKAHGPGIPESHFWYGVALGRIGQTKGVLNSLNLAGPVKKAFEKALTLNSKFTPAMDGLGVWYMEVPGIAGGSLEKSEEYFKNGLAIESNYTLLRVDLAKLYIKQKKYSDARTQLNKVLSTTNPKHAADYVLEDKPDAQRLLAEIEGK